MEKTVEKYLTAQVQKLGGLCVKFPPLYFAGFPDRIVLMPGAIVVFVELKDLGKKARPLQLRVHKQLMALGFRVEVIDSKDGVDNFLGGLLC